MSKVVNKEEFGLRGCNICHMPLVHTALNQGICDGCFIQKGKEEKMKKFEVGCNETVYATLTIEAGSEQEALEKAKKLIQANGIETLGSGNDWGITVEVFDREFDSVCANEVDYL